jgi:hypothetical protein
MTMRYQSLRLSHEGHMMAKNQPSLLVRCAFVVQIHADAQVEHGHLKGRVEHLASHQATHFESLAELLAFITQIVTEQQQ